MWYSCSRLSSDNCFRKAIVSLLPAAGRPMSRITSSLSMVPPGGVTPRLHHMKTCPKSTDAEQPAIVPSRVRKANDESSLVQSVLLLQFLDEGHQAWPLFGDVVCEACDGHRKQPAPHGVCCVGLQLAVTFQPRSVEPVLCLALNPCYAKRPGRGIRDPQQQRSVCGVGCGCSTCGKRPVDDRRALRRHQDVVGMEVAMTQAISARQLLQGSQSIALDTRNHACPGNAPRKIFAARRQSRHMTVMYARLQFCEDACIVGHPHRFASQKRQHTVSRQPFQHQPSTAVDSDHIPELRRWDARGVGRPCSFHFLVDEHRRKPRDKKLEGTVFLPGIHLCGSSMTKQRCRTDMFFHDFLLITTLNGHVVHGIALRRGTSIQMRAAAANAAQALMTMATGSPAHCASQPIRSEPMGITPKNTKL